MTEISLSEIQSFMQLGFKQKERIQKTPRFREIMDATHEIWRKWQVEFGQEAWILASDGIALKRNPGSKTHPFHENSPIPYWPKPWRLLRKVKRGTPQVEEARPKVHTPVEKVVEEVVKESEIPF